MGGPWNFDSLNSMQVSCILFECYLNIQIIFGEFPLIGGGVKNILLFTGRTFITNTMELVYQCNRNFGVLMLFGMQTG